MKRFITFTMFVSLILLVLLAQRTKAASQRPFLTEPTERFSQNPQKGV